jgi:hypothetical protein
MSTTKTEAYMLYELRTDLSGIDDQSIIADDAVTREDGIKLFKVGARRESWQATNLA